MQTYAITLALTTPATEHEAEAFAAELAEDARVHLRERGAARARRRRAGPTGAPACGA